MREILINDQDEGQKLKKLCFRILKEAPASFVYKMLRKKNITLNDKKATGEETLSAGDKVKFFLSDETYNKFSGAEVTVNSHSKSGDDISGHSDINNHTEALHNGTTNSHSAAVNTKNSLSEKSIIYIDDDIMLINKPFGILSQKAKAEDISINEMMLGYLEEKGLWSSKTFKPSVCNRLDRNTTGIILAGISIKGLQFLTEAVRDRRIDKFYLTICKGCFYEKKMLVNSYLSKDGKANKVEILTEAEYKRKGAPKNYSLISTEFRPISYSSDKKNTLLEVKLITGKTHQIRAQLANLGYPIVGDMKYDEPAKDARSVSIDRKNKNTKIASLHTQLLHAYRIHFNQGCGKYTDYEFTCDLPEYFRSVMNKLNIENSSNNSAV
ncbi:MAG: RluA family pseudouridine synthase [Eubacterium sp.]|nr:RluA family pseudouridine synthase [Eubacterium sp.]